MVSKIANWLKCEWQGVYRLRNKNPNLRYEHISIVNKLIDYIQAHLDQALMLENLASSSQVSPYHLHRIFKSIVGETLHAYVLRIRLEKAAKTLKYSEITDMGTLSRSCGFISLQHFSRSFRQRFGMNASEYRKLNHINSKFNAINSKNSKLNAPRIDYIEGQIEKLNDNYEVRIKTLKPHHLLYIRERGRVFESAFQGTSPHLESMRKVFDWGQIHHLWNPAKSLLVSVEHDDPNLTKETQCQMDCGITVDNLHDTNNGMGCYRLSGGKYAVVRLFNSSNNIRAIIRRLWEEWLPRSGFYYDNRPILTFHHNNPLWDPENRYMVDYAIPVCPARIGRIVTAPFENEKPVSPIRVDPVQQTANPFEGEFVRARRSFNPIKEE